MSDNELIKLVTQFRKGLLGKKPPERNCFVVSLPLQGYLSICGVESELVGGEIKADKELWNHFWLKLPDGRILDATADQFKTPDGKEMPKVYLGEKPEWYKIINKL